MNPELARLQAYPFERLALLLKDRIPARTFSPISLSIGEPKHAAPEFVKQVLIDNLAQLAVYPTTKGLPALREAIGDWLKNRFKLTRIDAETEILPVMGTREALFSFTQAAVDRSRKSLILMPAPFYQIYEGAAYLAGAEPYYLPCAAENGFVPDYDAVPDSIWANTQMLFVCSPGNPTGAVTSRETLQKLIALADKHNFIIVSDECYSEIYFDEAHPPVGLLQVCAETGRHDYARCIVFHSLSKRSNLPGLRSGFVAGDAKLLKPYLLYRTYHGAAMPVHNQRASIAAWSDETHVMGNRALYRKKFAEFTSILDPVYSLTLPDAGFYFWMRTPIADDVFTQRLYEEKNVTVLPGRFLGREVNDCNPGVGHVRLALVAAPEECAEAAHRLRDFLKTL
jgi:N-succinyldiaminopimelate aminotransferase